MTVRSTTMTRGCVLMGQYKTHRYIEYSSLRGLVDARQPTPHSVYVEHTPVDTTSSARAVAGMQPEATGQTVITVGAVGAVITVTIIKVSAESKTRFGLIQFVPHLHLHIHQYMCVSVLVYVHAIGSIYMSIYTYLDNLIVSLVRQLQELH